MAAPNATAIKARIMAHMNADHPDSLEDYLRFYNSITAVPQSAKMIDLDLDSTTIQYLDEAGVSQTSIVKINPPMTSLGESRVKLVAMAEEATGKSFHQPPDMPPSSAVPAAATAVVAPAKSIGWTRPELAGVISMLGVCFGFWALSQEYPLSRNGPLQAILPAIVVDLGRKFREQILALMIAIHAIEGSILAQKSLEQGLSLSLTVLWTINGAVEGFPAIQRFNRLIQAKQ
jgi:hypothetical protein